MTDAAPNHAQLLCVKAVAVALDCHEQTVRRLIRRGTLKAIRVGRSVKVSRHSLAAYYRDHQYSSDHV
jgi:excisionase family DNA binding protein